MATAQDIIKGALRRITSYQPGDPLSQTDEVDLLETLNDLLDSWSTDKLQIFGSNENITYWTANQNQYRIGNPTCTSIGLPPFTGTVTGGSNIITGITNIPSGLVAGSNANSSGAGSTLTDTANVIPAGTYVTAIGTNTVTMSAAAAATPSTGTDTITYTLPGDFAFPRPLRITDGFTRYSELDFTIEVTMSQSRYLEILYKAQPGPWPTVAWYNPLMPYGILSVYQTPGNSGECHLFTDTILTNLTINQVLQVPQGYVRALKWCLAKEICAEYGYPLSPSIATNAAESLKMVKALNAQPAVVSRYEGELVSGNRPDYGWITHGGFR
jgi:hypothetical protein